MKYLKSYKIFETNNSIKEELEDLLADLKDDGFNLVINSYIFKDAKTWREDYLISINKSFEKIYFSSIKDSIFKMIDYFKDKYKFEIYVKYLPKMGADFHRCEIKDLNKGNQFVSMRINVERL